MRSFQEGDLVLMWNAKMEDKGKHGKQDALWLGPFVIDSLHSDNSYWLRSMDDVVLELPMHGKFLKHYFK